MRQHEKDSQKSKSGSLLVIRFVPIINFMQIYDCVKNCREKYALTKHFFS